MQSRTSSVKVFLTDKDQSIQANIPTRFLEKAVQEGNARLTDRGYEITSETYKSLVTVQRIAE